MNATLHIAEVAERAGVSTATVRYYERIGVLPSPNRLPNGYRVYDDRTVERLEFIVRAKQLGCSLDEITDLVTAWDGGECGPVQDRLRSAVAEKLVATQAQVIELAALTDDLRRAAAALERHRQVGPCDTACGCAADTANSTSRDDPGDAAADELPIACTLTYDQVPGRLNDWNEFLDVAEAQRMGIPGGVRIVFTKDIDVTQLARFASAEQACCQFFTFQIRIDQSAVVLDVTAPDDALALVHATFGGSE